MGHPMPMMTGDLGDAPTVEDLSQVYSSYITEQTNSKRPTPPQRLDMPTVWKMKGKAIYKVELCPLSAKWYWTKMATCSCKGNMDD